MAAPELDMAVKLRVCGVSKKFLTKGASSLVLSDINLDVPENHVVALVGPTGCGKTTLLNILAGFEQPTSGTVSCDDRLINGPGPDRGMMFQQANLFPWLTVRDNVSFAARFGRGLSADYHGPAAAEAADEFLSSVGLDHAAGLYPHQISGGMQARTALGRVLLAQTPVLLMDEPFGALDALTRASMHKLMLRILAADRNRTVVLITHDVEEAVTLSDSVYIMSRGPGRLMERVDVPFGRDRDYDDVRRSTKMQDLKNRVLDALEPFINID